MADVEATIKVVLIPRVEVFFLFFAHVDGLEYIFLLTFLLFSMTFYFIQEIGPGLYLILDDVFIIIFAWLSFWRSRLPSPEAAQRGWPTSTRIVKENLRSWVQEELWSQLTTGNLELHNSLICLWAFFAIVNMLPTVCQSHMPVQVYVFYCNEGGLISSILLADFDFRNGIDHYRLQRTQNSHMLSAFLCFWIISFLSYNPLLLWCDRRRIHDSVKVPTLMMKRKMMGSNDLNQFILMYFVLSSLGNSSILH